jgi:hypothetical protein
MKDSYGTYESVAEELTRRIKALMPTHPEIATMQNEWDLTKVDGFTYDDLQPTFYQVSFALRKAQREARHD